MTPRDKLKNIVTALTQNPYDTEVLQSCIEGLEEIIKDLDK